MMQELIRTCWARNPAMRLSFTAIVERTQWLLHEQNRNGQDVTPRPGVMEIREESRSPALSLRSPSLEPQPDEQLEPASEFHLLAHSKHDLSASQVHGTMSILGMILLYQEPRMFPSERSLLALNSRVWMKHPHPHGRNRRRALCILVRSRVHT